MASLLKEKPRDALCSLEMRADRGEGKCVKGEELVHEEVQEEMKS